MNKSAVNPNFVSRVTVLTTEIEKLSDLLTQKGQEAELFTLQIQKLYQDNQYLKNDNNRLQNEFINLADHLKNRTIEYEELMSNYNRLKQIGMAEIQNECSELIKKNDSLTKLVQIQEQTLLTAKEQFITKTVELQQANQQVYHFQNSMNQVKEEKLRYMHEYQIKEKEVTTLQMGLKEMSDYEIKFKNSLVDIDLIRLNYGALFVQKESDRTKLNEQLNIQRELTNNNIEQVERKYADIIKHDKDSMREEYEAKLQSVVLQLENHVQTLTNLLETKQQDSERMQLQLENNVMRMRQEFTRDIQTRNQTITDLNNNNQRLMQLLQQMNQDVYTMEQKAGQGQAFNRSELLSLQNTVSHLTEQIHAYEARCHELQNQNDSIQYQMKDRVVLTPNDTMTVKKSPKSLENLDMQSEDKINYLLKVISSKNDQLQQRNNYMSQLTRMAIPNI